MWPVQKGFLKWKFFPFSSSQRRAKNFQIFVSDQKDSELNKLLTRRKKRKERKGKKKKDSLFFDSNIINNCTHHCSYHS